MAKNSARLTRNEFMALAAAVGLGEAEWEDEQPGLCRRLLTGWTKVKAEYYGDLVQTVKS